MQRAFESQEVILSLYLQDLEEVITPNTSLVSVMAVNNEIGVLQPLREIGKDLSKSHAHFILNFPFWLI